MITKNIIYKWFLDFQLNHTQLKDFGYGDFWEISQSEAVEYPLLWVCPIITPINDREILYTYRVLIADRISDGRTNAVEVESDTFQMCLDLIAAADQQQDVEWELVPTYAIEPVREEMKDNVDGHMFDIIFKVDFNYDECAIPKIN